jgi:predicted PilT family ATPase
MSSKTLMIKTLSPEDIPRFIGKGGSGMKNNVIVPSWRMYDEHIKSKDIEEEKPRLFVGINDSEGTVVATIKTESEIMRKFADHNLKKYIAKVGNAKEKRSGISVHTLFVVCPHGKVPVLIGRGGSVTKKMRGEASGSSNFSEENKIIADKSFIKINPYKYDSISQMNQMVRQDETKSYIGWEPEESDDDEFISVEISNRLKGEDFDTYVGEFKEVLNEKVRTTLLHHSRMMSDIDEALAD